jgi:amino acid transporter
MEVGRLKQTLESVRRKITLLPLVGATYFMVAGGPYGLEDLVGQVGFRRAIGVLLVVPIVWSLPTALMVGELAGALPEEGGYYAWVRRALGPFWGFVEAWLSLVASVFDMAIYPTLFALYLGRLWPQLATPAAATLLGAALIVVCAAWNVRGTSAVSGGAAVMTLLLLAPFAIMVALAPFAGGHATVAAAPAPAASAASGGFVAAILVAMWNYMGWDNASTIAGDVARPQRTYPLAMLAAVALVALTYVLPVAALGWSGVDTRGWTTGSWVSAAAALGGRPLGIAVVLGGVVCAAGMLNALMMSYSRLPLVLAEDGFLPAALARRHPVTGAPWVAIVVCAVAYMAALRIGFERLVELDVMLYGLSLVLEFVALVALRLREPGLPRAFRVPGGLAGAVAVGVLPTLMIAAALWQGRHDRVGGFSVAAIGGLVIGAAPLVYALRKRTSDSAAPALAAEVEVSISS